MIPVAAGILYLAFRISLSSEAAAIAMWFSSLSVVANSLLLNRFGGKWIIIKQVLKKTLDMLLMGFYC
ncbi:MAG TPA: hypothetical protein DEB50_05075 [Desulfobacter sp.]|jgi:hypothetical protein|nr:hypothetical protein [Desulfobacter sp.]